MEKVSLLKLFNMKPPRHVLLVFVLPSPLLVKQSHTTERPREPVRILRNACVAPRFAKKVLTSCLKQCKKEGDFPLAQRCTCTGCSQTCWLRESSSSEGPLQTPTGHHQRISEQCRRRSERLLMKWKHI